MNKINVSIVSSNVYFNLGIKFLVEHNLASLLPGHRIMCSIKSSFYDSFHFSDDSEHRMVIMDLDTSDETLYEGLKFITQIQGNHENIRIVVITRYTNPLVIKAISNRKPSVIMLQQEPLSVITQYLGITFSTFYVNEITLLSPIASSILSYARDLKCSPRELEIVVCQQDGLSLKETAKIMNIPYKKVSFLKCNLTRKLGSSEINTYTLG